MRGDEAPELRRFSLVNFQALRHGRRGRATRERPHGNEVLGRRRAPERGFVQARGAAGRGGEAPSEGVVGHGGERRAARPEGLGEFGGDVVRDGEWQRLLPHDRVREFRDGRVGPLDVGPCPALVDSCGGHHTLQQGQQALRHGEGFVALSVHLVLVVVHVGEGGVVESGQHRLALAGAERGHEPKVLHGHGIALLRHDRADLHVAVREPELAHLERGPEGHVLCESAEAERHDLERRVDARGVVGRRDAAVGVAQHGGEAEQFRHERPVERKARRGDRGGSHRAEVDHFARLQQALGVAEQHLDQRAEVMPEGRGLGRLAVGVGEDERARLRARALDQGLDHIEQPACEGVKPFAQGKFEEGVVDVVARSAGVQAAGDIGIGPPGELTLHEEEQVLVLAGVRLRLGPAPQIALDLGQGAQDGRALFGAEQLLAGQHDPVRPVKPEQVPEVVTLAVREGRREHGLGVGGGWEAAFVAEDRLDAGCRVHRLNLSIRRARPRG